MKGEDTQNQINGNPSEEAHFGKVKNVNVVMLGSESVISPPIVAEKIEEALERQNFRLIKIKPTIVDSIYSAKKFFWRSRV